MKRIALITGILACLAAAPAIAGGTAEEESAAGATTMAPDSKYREAPMLAELVASGALPPVEERLPEVPAVFKPLENIGKYGGTLNSFSMDANPWHDLGDEPERGGYLGNFAEDNRTVVGNLAQSVELSSDLKVITLTLRRGTRWSDGAPFTADDILFMYEDMHWHENVTTWGGSNYVKRVRKIDDYTVVYEADESSPVMYYEMGQWFSSEWQGYHPKHFLEQYHIEYNPNANDLAKEAGFEDWSKLMHSHYWWSPMSNIEKPTLQPWRFVKMDTTVKVFERNPYYWKVDAEGKQLPYIDRINNTIIDKELYDIKIVTGEADFAWMNTSFDNFTLYKENETQGDYRVILLPGFHGTEANFGINMNHSDPVERAINNDVRFRQALSLAINREEINEVVYSGRAVPRQATVLPTVSYYKPEWGEAFAEYDPARANALLDEMGLAERDKNGIRLRSDGKPVSLLIETSVRVGGTISTKLFELVEEYWKELGLEVTIKFQENALFQQRTALPEHGIIVSPLYFATEIFAFTEPYYGVSNRQGDISWAGEWRKWLNAKYDVEAGTKSLDDFEGGVLPGEEPPEWAMELENWDRESQKHMLGSPEYNELRQKVHDWHARHLVGIGTVGMAPQPLIAKNSLGNVPTEFLPWMGWLGDLNYFAEGLYFK